MCSVWMTLYSVGVHTEEGQQTQMKQRERSDSNHEGNRGIGRTSSTKETEGKEGLLKTDKGLIQIQIGPKILRVLL